MSHPLTATQVADLAARLTFAQAQMLEVLSKVQGASFEAGYRFHWPTLRRLEAKGLVFVDGGAGGWDAGITAAGRLVLAAFREL